MHQFMCHDDWIMTAIWMLSSICLIPIEDVVTDFQDREDHITLKVHIASHDASIIPIGNLQVLTHQKED